MASLGAVVLFVVAGLDRKIWLNDRRAILTVECKNTTAKAEQASVRMARAGAGGSSVLSVMRQIDTNADAPTGTEKGGHDATDDHGSPRTVLWFVVATELWSRNDGRQG